MTKNKTFLILLVFVLGSSFLYSESLDLNTKQRKEIMGALGTSNQGTRFFLTFHPANEGDGGTKNNDNRLYFTSDVATRVRVTIPGKMYEKVITTIPNGIIQIKLSRDESQCYSKDINEPPQPHQVFKGFAIIVEADDPIVVYGCSRYYLSTDSFLGIPETGYGKDYIAESYNDYTIDNGSATDDCYTSYFSVIGVYDNTTVNCILGGMPTNYTVGGDKWEVGETRKEKLNSGDIWLVGCRGTYNDITGTTIKSNKPVSVISGNYRTGIPKNYYSRDYLIEHILPMHTWGYKYHVTPIAGRKAGSLIRIFASKPNSIIYRDGEQWGIVKQVGGGESYGYLEKLAQNKDEAPRPVTLSSPNRIHVVQYNPTGYFDGSNTDPFQIGLTPIDQYQTQFIFCTPGFQGNGFQDNYMNLCYRSKEDGTIPEDIEFGYTPGTGGPMQWRKLTALVQTPGQAFLDPDVTDGRLWKALQISLWDQSGVYAIRSSTLMAAYGYGFESADSYGHPLSAALKDLSIPDSWAPTPEYTADCLGNYVGYVIDEPRNIDSLRSNLSFVGIDATQSFNMLFKLKRPVVITMGEDIDADWTLNVEDLEKDAKAVLFFNDRAGNDTSLVIEYKKTTLNITSKVVNWGLKAYNDPAETKEFTLSNDSEKDVTVDSLVLFSSDINETHPYNGFDIDTSIYDVLPIVMAPGEKLKFKVIFDPSKVSDDIKKGKKSFIDSIGIKANWSDDVNDYCYFKYKATVKSSTGQPYIEVDRLDFGKVTVNDTKILTVPLYNNGSSDLTITGYSVPDGFADKIYIPEMDTKEGPNDKIIVSPGVPKSIKVYFTPNKVGQFPDKVVFTSDADVSYPKHDPILELTGEGIQPGLTVYGNEWVNMRTHLKDYDNTGNPYGNSTFPYPWSDGKAPKEVRGLKLINTGNQAVQLNAITYDAATAKNADAFLIDMNGDDKPDQTLMDALESLKGSTLDTGETNAKYYNVFFDPKVAGNHYIKLNFTGIVNGFNVTDECEFIGTAIYPKTETNDYMFTEDEVNDIAIVGQKEYIEKDITISTLDWNTEKFNDDMTIYSINISDKNLISNNGTISNNQVFTFDESALALPRTIKIGETLTFKARFYPTRSSSLKGENPFAASITFVTDAEGQDFTSNWTAKSVLQNAVAKGFARVQCQTYSTRNQISISNTGDDKLVIDNIDFVNHAQLFTLDPSLVFPIEIEPKGADRIIDVFFKDDNAKEAPSIVRFHTRNVLVPIIFDSIKAKTVLYGRDTYGTIDGGKFADAANPFKISYDQNPQNASNNFKYQIWVDKNFKDEDMQYLTLNTPLQVVIKYNSNVMGSKFINSSSQVDVKLGDILKDDYKLISAFEAEETKDSTTNDNKIIKVKTGYNLITINIDNTSGKPINTKDLYELLSIDFDIFQNKYDVGEIDDPRRLFKIEHDVISKEGCLSFFTRSEPLASLAPVCAQNTRLIKFNSGKEFKIEEINPTPVTSSGTKINYSLGFDCKVKFKIYDINGNVIDCPISETNVSGNHNFNLPIEKISSGVYFIEMVAGPYKETKRFVVAK